MKNKTALFGLSALVAFIGFKISVDPSYVAAKEAIGHHPPLALQQSGFFTGYFTPSKTNFPIAEKTVSSTSVDSLLKLAHTFMGTAYRIGGNTPAGFDCSGFTNYVYGKCGYDVPHGSVNQALVGRQVSLEDARKGDLLIFTGTDLSVREPGHVGIVISKKGEPVKFIHSSSNGGVKISEVPNTRYADRLLQVRRVL